MTIHHGDCLEVMHHMPEASVDAICTDPPYGLGFMGKAWDDLPPGLPWAQECLRVLKPGGFLMAFGGTRTWHRLAVAIEDAGFEMRDSIAWIFGSGFPKSLNVGKDAQFCQCGPVAYSHADSLCPMRDGSDAFTEQGEAAGAGVLHVQLPVEDGPSADPDGEPSRLDREDAGASVRGRQPRLEGWGDVQAAEGELRRTSIRPLSAGVRFDGAGRRVRAGAPAGDGAVDRSAAYPVRDGESRQPQPAGQLAGEPRPLADERGSQEGRGRPLCPRCGKQDLTGWGTALKPAFEPIVVARKPLVGTVAANVLAHGTGALNIDGTRVPGDVPSTTGTGFNTDKFAGVVGRGEPTMRGVGWTPSTSGRWPTNVVFDDHAAAELDDAARYFPTFKYQAKAPTRERPSYVKDDGTKVAHPTVKPLDLMRWLVRLVTPPGGTVLDPFAGSGATIEACILEGFDWIAIERDADYLPLIGQRITRSTTPTPTLAKRTPASSAAIDALTLFDTEEPA